MKRTVEGFFVGAMALLLACAFTVSCSNDEEETKLKATIQTEISNLQNEVNGMEEQQKAMLTLIDQMTAQLDQMKAELAKDKVKVTAANKNIKALRDYTTQGFGPSPFDQTLENPSWNVLWVLFFVLLLWLFYRMRHRSLNQPS